ncbi:hypothetical protein SCMU_21060 [Sinomonas cyclohexanicum]|uniref:Guanylate cyclase domain-containing protein n=1 Tax=Sinomonas cyclohexanicum TaxID=322009 RepID=A0ABN6FHY8_SINCY|nr:adenylate/guanylate cyclase domain-containing protein [Corynebacterium cyclohexanicum]BCT76264.1 hypothetical protein SCMU_21060 [Corynebacterium cyclohexanicum]
MSYSNKQFGQTVMHDFQRRRDLLEKGGITASAGTTLETRGLGHPMFEELRIGERRSARIATVFLDLTNFTGRTFWDDAVEVTDLAHAILTGFVEVVSVFGGHPLGLRGDGLFAGFGPGKPDVVCSLALGACAFALDGVQNELNPRLAERGLEPVQARAGVDFGEVTFVRSGSQSRSEVNAIGFSANFAAKCEKAANSWEVVAGEGLVTQLGTNGRFSEHPDSPKHYQRDYQRRAYKYFDYRWRQVLPILPSVIQQLNGRPASAITVG